MQIEFDGRRSGNRFSPCLLNKVNGVVTMICPWTVTQHNGQWYITLFHEFDSPGY